MGGALRWFTRSWKLSKSGELMLAALRMACAKTEMARKAQGPTISCRSSTRLSSIHLMASSLLRHT
jgi:hypothetical protein